MQYQSSADKPIEVIHLLHTYATPNSTAPPRTATLKVERKTTSETNKKCRNMKPRFSRLTRILNRKFSSNTEENILKSKLPPIQAPRIPLPRFVWEQNVKHHADKIALVNGLTNESYTFSDSAGLSQSFGSAMIKRGFKKNDVLGILLPNCVEYVFAVTGAIGASMTVTTFNPAYTSAEIAKQINMSKAKIMLTNKEHLAKVCDAIKKTEKNIDIIAIEDSKDTLSMSSLLKDDGSAYPEQPDSFDFDEDVVLLPYSSGTTGLPKGVMLTHANLVWNTAQCLTPKELECIRPATETYQAKTIGVLPMFHIFGVGVVMLHTLCSGGRLTLLPGFEPNLFLKTLRNSRPDILHLVPPLVQFCASSPDVTPSDLESLEFAFIGAAPIGEALAAKFKEKAPNCLFREGWGMTELSPVGAMTAASDEVLGSCGILLPNSEGKVVDTETGEPLGPMEKGELCIKGPQIMKGYFDNETATQATMKNGWLHSGDIGYYDKHGRIFIVDRLKELIKVKGFQVAPAELEDLLRQHTKVQDVAVIGVPDDRYGEVPKAFIVPKEKVTTDELHDFISSQVADFKKLRGGIEFIEQIPKSAAGKILRRQLRDR